MPVSELEKNAERTIIKASTPKSKPIGMSFKEYLPYLALVKPASSLSFVGGAIDLSVLNGA